ncbi:MAG: VOC family protein [Pseudomonadales bacterium]|nr:VOC family protein [Pseudomonadales bacterium]
MLTTRELDTDKVNSPGKFAHIVINTPQILALKDWYAQVLGMRVVSENDLLCFLTYDNEHHRLALVNNPKLKQQPEKTAGINHFAYTLADLGSLLSSYMRLKKADILPWWCINHGPTTSMYYHDPDGNGVELQVDNFDDEGGMQWMLSDRFKENPLGIEFDPETLVNKYKSGVAIEELLKQGSAPKPIQQETTIK